jgi:hypothetical protein
MVHENGQVQDNTHRIFLDIFTEDILYNLQHYDTWRITEVMLSIFREGNMFRVTENAREVLQRIHTTRQQRENSVEAEMLMEFLAEFAEDIPQRFIYLTYLDTLSNIEAQLEEIIQQQHIAHRQERRHFLEEHATELEEFLRVVPLRRETEYYELEYEEYQENDETRHRFVMVYYE